MPIEQEKFTKINNKNTIKSEDCKFAVDRLLSNTTKIWRVTCRSNHQSNHENRQNENYKSVWKLKNEERGRKIGKTCVELGKKIRWTSFIKMVGVK